MHSGIITIVRIVDWDSGNLYLEVWAHGGSALRISAIYVPTSIWA